MLQAVGTKLVIQRIARQEQTTGGIIISNQQEQNPRARILSKGTDVKIVVEPGDTVIVSWPNTLQVRDDYYIVDETGVYAKETTDAN